MRFAAGWFGSTIYGCCRRRVVVQTDHGAVRLYKSVGDHAQFGRPIVFVQRHRADPAQDYTLPHAINRPAVALALKAMGVTAVVAFNSVGSLQTNLPPNTVLVPHDFLCFWKCDYVYNDNRAHLVPGYHTGMRNALLNVLNEGGFKPVDKGGPLTLPGRLFANAVYYRRVRPDARPSLRDSC